MCSSGSTAALGIAVSVLARTGMLCSRPQHVREALDVSQSAYSAYVRVYARVYATRSLPSDCTYVIRVRYAGRTTPVGEDRVKGDFRG